MTCTDCKATWEVITQQKFTHCPFCTSKLKDLSSYPNDSLEWLILDIVYTYGIEIYEDIEKFNKILSNCVTKDYKFIKLLQKIVAEGGTVELYDERDCSIEDLAFINTRIVYSISEETFISREILQPAVDLLWFGLGRLTSNIQNISDFEVNDGVLTGYYGDKNYVTIPDFVIEIAPYCFSGFKNLEEVIIPCNIKKIGNNAFEYCLNLKSIKIPNSVEIIEHSMFRGCENLAFVHLPESIEKIGKSAFRGCKNLNSIKIPNTVKEIEEYTFSGCDSLHSVKLSTAITEIGIYAFATCKNIHTMRLPESLKSIKEHAFYECENLRSINVPKKLKSVGDYAFTTLNGANYWNLPLDYSIIKELKKINPASTA